MSDPILGPARCNECHAPGLFYFGRDGWRERWWQERGVGRTRSMIARYRLHVCLARRPLFVRPIGSMLR
jgi:hypothetical protein